MNEMKYWFTAIMVTVLIGCSSRQSEMPSAAEAYPWKVGYDQSESLYGRIREPFAFERQSLEPGSFAAWLRYLPVLPGKPELMRFNGAISSHQQAYYAILDVPIGNQDAVHGVEAALLLKSLYALSRGEASSINILLNSGAAVSYAQWQQGYRFVSRGNEVFWEQGPRRGTGWQDVLDFLISAFPLTNSAALREVTVKIPPQELTNGSLLFHDAASGHVVMVMDVAIHPQTGDKLFLLAQGFTPAHQLHILVNPKDPTISPWYRLYPDQTLETPLYIFHYGLLRQWRDLIPQP